MQAIEFKSYFNHGQIPVPSAFHLKEGQNIRVLVLIDELEQPETIWQRTAGAWQGEPLCREPQGNFEQRLEFEQGGIYANN
jgi:hypothetical protein